MFHCRYGYSVISPAHGGVFSSRPPTMVITSWPLGTRRRVSTEGTVTVSAATKCSEVRNAPQVAQAILPVPTLATCCASLNEEASAELVWYCSSARSSGPEPIDGLLGACVARFVVLVTCGTGVISKCRLSADACATEGVSSPQSGQT